MRAAGIVLLIVAALLGMLVPVRKVHADSGTWMEVAVIGGVTLYKNKNSGACLAVAAGYTSLVTALPKEDCE